MSEIVRRLAVLEEDCTQNCGHPGVPLRFSKSYADGRECLDCLMFYLSREQLWIHPADKHNCKGTGKVPLIRTAQGRTLRGETCPCSIPDVDGIRLRDTVDDWDFNDENWLDGIYEGEPSSCECQGTGWLPVSDDEAHVVCVEWLYERDWVYEVAESVSIFTETTKVVSAPIQDHTVTAALLEAVEKVTTEITK